MSRHGKSVSQIEIKSDADLFHELFRYKPHHLPNISPDVFSKVDLHEGDFGTVGSVLVFNYSYDGKEYVAKEVVEAIDEAKKFVKLKVIEGDLLELYKNLSLTIHVDTHGENNLVTWTLEYEKVNENIPDPNTLLDLAVKVTKDVEAHHLGNESSGKTKKLVSSIEIKSDGDLFLEIFRDRPHQISNMSPRIIQGCDLHDGDWGKVGSVIARSYTYEGKPKVAKDKIEAIDEAKKSVTFRKIEGDPLQLYKTLIITVHVDTTRENNLVTWTVEYEKQNESVPEPNSLMELFLIITKDIETHHLK